MLFEPRVWRRRRSSESDRSAREVRLVSMSTLEFSAECARRAISGAGRRGEAASREMRDSREISEETVSPRLATCAARVALALVRAESKAPNSQRAQRDIASTSERRADDRASGHGRDIQVKILSCKRICISHE